MVMQSTHAHVHTQAEVMLTRGHANQRRVHGRAEHIGLETPFSEALYLTNRVTITAQFSVATRSRHTAAVNILN